MTHATVKGQTMTQTIELDKLTWTGTKSGVSQKGVAPKITFEHNGYEYSVYPTVYRTNIGEAKKRKESPVKTSKASPEQAQAPAQDINAIVQAAVAQAMAALMQAQAAPAPAPAAPARKRK